MIYAMVDDELFVSGWSSSEEQGSIKVKKESMSNDMMTSFRKYRYVEQIKDFIIDESKVIRESKESKIFEMNNKIKELNEYGFYISIRGEKLRFKNTSENKSFIQKAFSMTESGLIESTTTNFIDSNGNEIPRNINKTNIYELWILSFMHEDELNKHFNEVIMPQIENAKTLEELSKITWEGSQV